jgi:methionyl-tRNA formyltransferase
MKHNIEPTVATEKSCLATIITVQNPSLVFVCGWYWIIPDTVLRQVPLGILGIHNSLLPKYRGHAPLVWSMINGDECLGASLFQIESGMDTGKVFYQWRVNRNERYLTDVLADLDMLIESESGKILSEVLTGKIKGYEQDDCLATYSAKRRSEDSLIDWEQPAQKIVLQIRALSTPYPSAFTFINGRKVFILKAEVFEYPVFGFAGQVVFTTAQYTVISCGYQQGIKVHGAVSDDCEESIIKLFGRLSSPSKHFE